MKMIIGGAFQGKTLLAKKIYPDIDWINGADADWEKIASAQGILCFHEFIRKEMQIGNDVSKLAERLIQVNPQVVLVSDEVGLYPLIHLIGRIVKQLAEYVRSLPHTARR